MDAPSGVSFFVTRDCMDRVGLMDEDYFLYFEEFDWGILAKAACGLGYAHKSVVPHISGSSTGAVRSRAQRSRLSVYLTYRNRIRFVQRRFPTWTLWTVLVSFPADRRISARPLAGEFLGRLARDFRGAARRERPASGALAVAPAGRAGGGADDAVRRRC